MHGGFFAVVADGMGGHNAGDVASRIVVDTVVEALESADPETVTKEDVENILVSASNRNVWENAQENRERSGMGSTATLAVFKNGQALVGQVGDSRAYLFREGVLTQITKDHSYVQRLIDDGYITEKQARYHPQRNVITRAIGTDTHVEVDVFTVALEENDCILLCSDGLNTAVRDDKIEEIMRTDKASCADRLVDAALKSGGKDNISVVIADMGGEGK